MVSKREILGMIKPSNSSFATSEVKGGVGYDNPRENIDPHIKTKVLDAKEIKINGQTLDSLYVNASGDTMTGNLDVTGFEVTADTVAGTSAVSTNASFYAQSFEGLTTDFIFQDGLGAERTLSFAGGILIGAT